MLRKDGQFNHYEPPYEAEVPGAPIILILPNESAVGAFELVPGTGSDVATWPGIAGDSVRLPLGSKVRPLAGSQAGDWFTFRMYRGQPSMIPDRWAQYYV